MNTRNRLLAIFLIIAFILSACCEPPASLEETATPSKEPVSTEKPVPSEEPAPAREGENRDEENENQRTERQARLSERQACAGEKRNGGFASTVGRHILCNHTAS